MNHENLETHLLAGVGAVAGVARYYRPSASTLAWGAILAYEIAAPPGELLSEGADTAIRMHPYLTRIAIGVTALHLANVIPDKYDPIHQGLKVFKGL